MQLEKVLFEFHGANHTPSICNTEGIELQKPPIPPTVPDDEERKRRAFADVDEFTVTTHERSLCKKTKAERERAWRLWNRYVPYHFAVFFNIAY